MSKLLESKDPFVLDYRDLLDSAPDGILLVDYVGVIHLVNRQVETLFGYSREELVGQRIETLVPARFAGSHPKLRDSYVENPVSRSLASGQGLEARHKDGSEFSVAISLSPIATAGGPAVLTAVRDITELVDAERSRQQRTLEAQLLLFATEVGADADTVEDALQAVISRVCEDTGWPVGHAYQVDQADRDRLIATRLWHVADAKRFVDFQRITETMAVARGTDLPGGVLESGELQTWVDRGDLVVLVFTLQAVEVPPGHAVHRRGDRCIGTQKRLHRIDHAGCLMRLQ